MLLFIDCPHIVEKLRTTSLLLAHRPMHRLGSGYESHYRNKMIVGLAEFSCSICYHWDHKSRLSLDLTIKLMTVEQVTRLNRF